MTDIDSANCVL